MIANPDKFKAITLKKPSLNINDDISIAVGDKNVKPTPIVSLLGVKIDEKLNFRQHINYLCRKAGAKLNAIKRLKYYLDEKERKILVDSHVISQFNYCSIVWHFCGLTEIHKIEKLHERCTRFIYNDQSKA